MGSSKAYRRKNKLRKYHNRGAKVNEGKKSTRKEPIFKIVESLKQDRWR